MNKEEIQKALAQVKAQPTRKFSQSYELIINLKNLVIKQNPLDFFVTLHFPKGKKIKVAAFVGTQLQDQAKEYCDLVISESDFGKYSDKKELKKLADSYDYFIAQANLMPTVAKTFGKVLGIKGKMPNPKLGCVVPPNANLEPLVSRLNLAVRMQAKKATNLQCMVGKENQPDTEIVDNILTVYTMTLKQLPNEIQNVKSVILKTTMGTPVKI
jgi:large subunit ribosomal protein L1